MDARTGEIYNLNQEGLKAFFESEDGGESKLSPELQKLQDNGIYGLNSLQNPDCDDCHGEGWAGRDSRTGYVVPCQCVAPVSMQEISEPERIKQRMSRNEQRIKQGWDHRSAFKK